VSASIHFFKVCTQKGIPVSTANIISERELSKWPFLDDVKIPLINAEVDLLIGTNTSKLMEPWEVINSREGEGPCVVRSLLGRVIMVLFGEVVTVELTTL